MVSSGPGHPTKYVVLFKRGSSCDEEEEDWKLEDLYPDSNALYSRVADIRGELDGSPCGRGSPLPDLPREMEERGFVDIAVYAILVEEPRVRRPDPTAPQPRD